MGFYDISADITVLVVAGLLMLTMRWIFRPSRPRSGPPVNASDARELGLLTVLRTGLSREQAAALRAELHAAEIRSSASRRDDGRLDVLVFGQDVDQAQQLLGR